MRKLRIVHSEAATSFGGQEGRIFKEMTATVSYTHLTLPTIYSV